MASGDFVDIEAGDTLAILKNESIIMDRNFDFNTKHDDGDFADMPNNGPNFEWELLKHKNEAKCNEKTSKQRLEIEKRLGHRRVHTDGVVTYKKIQTSKIMDTIQLGIQRSVGGLAANTDRDVLMLDFMTVETTSFTADDPVLNSAHHPEFVFKTYAPVAFRHFRDLFGIKPDNFVSSFCEAPLVELPNAGASGSVFYLTQNDEFITKTVQHREAEFLQKLLPGYYLNLNQNPRTLLPKFFGLYCYKRDSKNVRMVVMNNVLPSSIKIHQKYDLKGSTYNRKASKTERQKILPTFKDLDFNNHHPEGIFLEADAYQTLVKTIQRDCRVLESFRIMDYSLLVGVHNLDQAKKEKIQTNTVEQQCSTETNNTPSGDGNINGHSKENNLGNSKATAKVKNETQNNTNHARYVDSIFDGKCVPPEGLPAKQANGESLLLFIGIIDILQSYRMKKRLEHAWKSILHDGDSVSVHNPGFYAQRFQEFMSNTVFKTISSSSKNCKRKCISGLKSDEI